MKTLAERLRYAMEVLPSKKIKGVELARAVGVKPPSVSDWLSGKSKTMEGENLLKASKFLKVNPAWLASGVGNPETNDTNASIPINMDGDVRSTLNMVRKIPILDYVQAGIFHDVGYDGLNPLGETYTTYQSAKPECVFSLEVSGLSMAPDYLPGDKIVVDASLVPKPGSLVIAQEVQHGEARTTFKKYRVIGVNEFGVDIIELVPLNNDFPTYNSTQIEISIIGVVVQHSRDIIH